MTTAASKMALLSTIAPPNSTDNLLHPATQQSSLQPHQVHSYHSSTGSASQFDDQSGQLVPSHHPHLHTPSALDNSGNQQQLGTMMSQASPHQFDHSLAPQPAHYSHHRHISNVSSISSLGSGHQPFEHNQFSQPNPVHDAFAVPASFSASASAGAAFGGVPVSADAFHQYPSHHHRSASASSSSFTEPTSISEGNSPEGVRAGAGVPGGRKVSQAQMMRRARAHASPYTIRADQLPWNGADHSASGSASGLPRSHSVASDAPSTTEDEIAELLRSQSESREGSVSDWNQAPGSQTHQQGQSSGAQHLQTGLGSAGAFMDPYAAVANAHGHAGAFGPTMVSIGNGGPNHLGGLVPNGLVGVSGMVNTALVGGVGAQMGRMTLDSTETYEALAHHIRTAVTTSAADRARQAFVQAWLNSSYISYTDGNVSRQGLYGSYLRICQQYDIKPINSASFGKAVRQSFPNIKTRRLGVRGNSKYHYCGIRPATAKEAEILMNLSRSEQMGQTNGSQANSSTEDDVDSDGSPSRRMSLPPGSMDDKGLSGFDEYSSQPQTPRTARPSMSSLARLETGSQVLNGQGNANGLVDSNGQEIEQVMPLPNLEEALCQPLAQDLDHQRAREFWKSFVDHAQSLLESVKGYRFDQFELNLRTFWASLEPSHRECATHPTMMSLIYRADAVIYDEILDYLHSQTLTQMPQQAFGSLRQLAQSMEQVIIVAMENYPSTFVGPKIELAARFGHLVVRNLGICQLAQALSGVFSNPNSLKDMAEAWDGIDFEAVRNQAALVTNCQHDILGVCFEEFRQILNNPNASIDHFIAFVELTYERCLQPTLDGDRRLTPRSLLVRWCFVSAQLIRDLTLRSASSFGSFQIVNLFFDEWLGFKVLRKVALHVAAVAASVDTTSCDVNASQGQSNVLAGSMMYSGGNSSQSSSYQGFSDDLSQHLQPESLNAAGGSTPTVATSAAGSSAGTDGFAFSPNTSHAFGMAQHQAVGGSEVLSPNRVQSAGDGTFTMMGAVSSHSNTSMPLSGHHSDHTSPSTSSRSPNGHTASAPHESPNPMLNQSVVTGAEGAVAGTGPFDDQAFNELMDVSGFSMTMNNTNGTGIGSHSDAPATSSTNDEGGNTQKQDNELPIN